MQRKEDLKDWLERRMDEDMKELGFTKQITPSQTKQKVNTPISATITFVKKAKTLPRYNGNGIYDGENQRSSGCDETQLMNH